MHVRRTLLAGALIAASLFATAPAASAADVAAAVELTNHNPGSHVGDGDLRAAMRRIGHNPGRSIDRGDIRRLQNWANRIEKVRTTALAQVGDPYRYGATGPGAFDCSGLTLFSYRSAGWDLPRTSRSQARATRGVSKNDLRPGDLLFYGRPVGHVAMYVGDGKMVHSPRPGRNVTVKPMRHRNLVKVGRVAG